MRQNKTPIVEFDNVYIQDSLSNIVFKRLSFKIYEKETVFILGHSDKERTLILYSMLGMIKPKIGAINVLNEELNNLSKIKLLELRKKIGYVYPQKGLIKNITVKENISLPLRFNTKLTEKEINMKVKEISNILDLSDCLNESCWGLDNTIEKKILIARAIINNPYLLLIDEPTTYIEQKDLDRLIELFDIVLKRKYIYSNAPIIITSEDFHLAEQKADRIFNLKYGEIDFIK
ncbi:MAG: ATP-binding cassette domain-containing protein [Spirochaetes bacterium]|nr:ATP-binding cassette domain-containing protein [Spirochaetota bacterium]